MLVFALGFEGESGQVFRVAGQHVVVVGVGDGDGDRAASVVDAGHQRLDLGAGGALDGEHRAGFAVLGVQAQFAHAAGSGGADQGGLGHAVAEVFEVEQGAELGQRHAFHGRGGVGCGAEACRVRGEAEQVDRTAGGGQQVGGDRGEQSAGCGDVAAQGLVKAGIGGLVCQGYRPRGEGERMGLGG